MIERTFSHEKGVISYLEGGDGPNLLFLHGAFAMPHAYEPFLAFLAGQYHVIAPTHPGHGESFKITPIWSYTDYIETYTQFLERLSFVPSVLVGHSFGGAFSLSLGQQFPHAHIVVMDAAGLPFPFIVKDFLSALLTEGEDAIKKDPNRQTMQELGRAARALFLTVKKHPENIPWFYRYGPTLDLSQTISALTNPIGLLWGEDDKVVPLAVGERMKQLMPHSILKTYPGFEHDYVITEPDFTYGEIQEMISLISQKK